MKLKLPQYNGKDNLVMLVIVPVFAIFFNGVNFLPMYVSDGLHFAAFTLLSIVLFAAYFVLCGGIAVYLKHRFPDESDVFKRLSVSIFSFLLATGLFLRGILQLYESLSWFGYTFSAPAFLWNYVALGIINIFLVFFMEGISRYNDWKKSLAETDAIKRIYQQGRLHALKNQVNPHFLFNCLNTLSSLIQENEEKADVFLNEMTRVYRYLLRSDAEQLVPLDTELRFIESYISLLNTRYGEALKITIHLDENIRQGKIAPLALQVVIENIITQNIISRNQPLSVSVETDSGNAICIKNKIQLKQLTDRLDADSGLDNLIKKYELLGMPVTVAESADGFRRVQIPVQSEKEVAV